MDADPILDDHVMLDHAMAADGDGIADDIALAEERAMAGLKATANGVTGIDDGVRPDRSCRSDIRGERPRGGALRWLADDDEIANGAAGAHVYGRIQPECRLRGISHVMILLSPKLATRH